MPFHMKNAGSCALSSDTIYVFGGKACEDGGELQFSNQILMYLVAANTWIRIPVSMPMGVGLITPIKIN